MRSPYKGATSRFQGFRKKAKPFPFCLFFFFFQDELLKKGQQRIGKIILEPRMFSRIKRYWVMKKIKKIAMYHVTAMYPALIFLCQFDYSRNLQGK
jgi:hypothetical protein